MRPSQGQWANGPPDRRWGAMKCLVVVVLVGAMGLVASCSGDKGTGPGKVNHPPVIAEVRDTTAIAGYTLCIPLETFDEDGDSLQFRLYIVCSWSEIQLGRCPIAEVRSSSEEFWFWPRGFDIPLREFMIVVSDSAGGSDSTDFMVAVRAMQCSNEEACGPWAAGDRKAADHWLVEVLRREDSGEDFGKVGVGAPCR
jgi:hypothetical protein